MTDTEFAVKEEPMDESMDRMSEEEVEPLAFGPAALGLHRVGTVLPPKPQPTQPIQVLNARGMPARIRKKNKLFFDDDIVNDSRALRSSPRKGSKPSSPVKSPVKVMKKRRGMLPRYTKVKEDDKDDEIISQRELDSPQATPSKKQLQREQQQSQLHQEQQQIIIPADRKVGQQIGLRLRNLLKLPKAHKWVIFEWFYSFIDRPLFDGDNDFQICLKESFPMLKTRMLTRAEWSKIRSMLGKPRRCSQLFFDEERRELERRRQKMRLLQAKRYGDVNFIKDLPSEIPLPLPVGTRVTARLRTPQDGVFSGSVDAVDSVTSTYRITFDRVGLGTHSIPDYEIVSIDFNETLPITSLTQDLRFRPKLNNSIMSPSKNRNALNKSDPLLGQDLYESQFKNPVMARETVGGYPIKLLELIIRLKKTLTVKQNKVQRLRELNSEAEMQKSYSDGFSEDFQRRYASVVVAVERINRDMQEYLTQIQSYATELAKEPSTAAMLAPSYLREKCREMAEEAVQRNNQNIVTDEKTLKLITELATVMIVASHLAAESGPNIFKILEGCIEEVKNSLDEDNIEVFQKNIQIHLHHIRLGIGQMAMAGVSGPNVITSKSINEQNS